MNQQLRLDAARREKNSFLQELGVQPESLFISAYALIQICDDGAVRLLRESSLTEGEEQIVIFERPVECIMALDRQRGLEPEKNIQATRVMATRFKETLYAVIPKSEMLLINPITEGDLANAPIVFDCRPEIAHLVEQDTFKDLCFPLVF